MKIQWGRMADRIEGMPEPALAVTKRSEVVASVGRGLAERGWWLGRQAVDGELVDGLAGELAELIAADHLTRAGIGRDLDFQVTDQIRATIFSG